MNKAIKRTAEIANLEIQMQNLERNTGFKFCLDGDSHPVFRDDEGNEITIESIILDWYDNDK